MENIESQFIIVGKKRNAPFKLCFKIYGNGKEKVFLIMGFLSKSRYWEETAKYLTNTSKYTVCIFDHVGVGESGYSTLSSVYDLALDSLELIEHLQWDKTHVVGISLGALIGYELSLIAPYKIKTLNMTATPPNHKNLWFNQTMKRMMTVGLSAILYDKSVGEIFANLNFSQSFLNAPSKIKHGSNREFIVPLISHLSNEMNKTPLKIQLAYVFAAYRYKIKPYHKEKEKLLKRPFQICMFAGTSDRFMTWKDLTKACQIIQPNKIFICKDAGHGILYEDMSEYHKQSEVFFSYNPLLIGNGKKEFLAQHPLDYNCNSKTFYSKIEENPLSYYSTPITQLPIFKNHLKKVFQYKQFLTSKFITNFKLILK